MEIFVLSILFGVCVLFLLWVKRKFEYFKDRGIPYLKPEFYFGNARGVGTKIHLSELLRKVYLEFKNESPIAGLFLYTNPVYVITDPELVKQIFVRDFNNFPNRGRYFNEKDDPLSATLINIEDDGWRKLRSKISPTFSSGKIKMMFDLVAEISDKLVETIKQEITKREPVEIDNLFARFTTDVIASVAFGIESNTLRDNTNSFLEMGLKATGNASFLIRTFLINNRGLGNKLRVPLNHRQDVREFYLDVVRKTIEYRELNPHIQRNDFINLLMKLKDPSLPDPITFNQISAQCMVFFLAGHETTASTLTYCLFELSQNEEIQSKARESVRSVLEKYNNELTYDTLSEMHYLEQCVDEALRMYPPGYHINRRAKEDYAVPNTKIVIQKGSLVMVPIYAFHRDPDFYPEPQRFDPSRFQPNEIAKRHSFAFLPFGEGPRVCIAKRFALVEIKIALAKLLLQFKFSLDRSQTSVPMKIAPNKHDLMIPGEGVFVNFYKL